MEISAMVFDYRHVKQELRFIRANKLCENLGLHRDKLNPWIPEMMMKVNVTDK